MKESTFQKNFIDKLGKMCEGEDIFITMKNDANYRQGFPDFSFHYKGRTAFIEFKKSKNAPHRPNQDYYISELSKYNYASFCYPENEKEVLDELSKFFGV